MTLIIGIRCSDGIVLGADGAATLGSMGQRTVRQPIEKLSIIDDRVVLGVSGPIGLSQLFADAVETLWGKKRLSEKTPAEAMRIIRGEIIKDQMAALQAAAVAQPVIGAVAQVSALAALVIAVPVSRELCLFQFDQQGTPEQATENLPFLSIGSGQSIADPFLAFIRRVLWKENEPNLADGQLAAFWCLDHAIKSTPGGIAEPKQIATLDASGARLVDAAELAEMDEAIDEAEGALAKWREGFTSDATGEEPPSPE